MSGGEPAFGREPVGRTGRPPRRRSKCAIGARLGAMLVAGLAVGVVVGVAAGCGSGRDSGGEPVAAFLLASIDPAETLALGPPEVRVVERFSFDEGTDGFVAGPQVEGLVARSGKLVFRSTGADPHVVASGLAIEAGGIDRLALDISVSRFGSMPSVYWATEAEPEFSEDRRQYFTLERTSASSDAMQSVTVDLAGHPQWGGKVTAIRVDPSDLEGAVTEIDEIRFEETPRIFDRVSSQRIRDARAGDVWRRVRIAPAGDDWTVRVRAGGAEGGDEGAGALDLGFGPLPYSLAQADGALRFRVDVVGASGRSLLDETIAFSEARAGAVRQRRLPLASSDAKGAAVTLRFRVDATAGSRVDKLAGMWASPTRIAGADPAGAGGKRAGAGEGERKGANRGDGAPPNLLVVSLDTLRADRLGCYGYAKDTSPRIDRLAAEGVAFDRAWAQAPETLASHMSLMTGRLPVGHGILTETDDLPAAFETLAGSLLARGLRTAAFTEGGYIAGRYGFRRGFQTYHDGTEPTDERPGGDVERTFARARDWLDRYGHEPFFLFVHTYEIHVPYAPPAEFRTFGPEDYDGPYRDVAAIEQFGHVIPINAGAMPADDEDRAWIEGLYDGEIAFTDREVGRLVDHLESLGRLENTWVVVLSDHGEEFGEHGGFGLHGHTLYDEIVHVPLIVRGPGAPAGRRVEREVGLFDLFPTFGKILGSDVPDDLDGRSFARELAPSPPDAAPGPGDEARAIVSEDGTVYHRAAIRSEDVLLVETREVERWWVDEILAQGSLPLAEVFLDVVDHELYRGPIGERGARVAGPGIEDTGIEEMARDLAERRDQSDRAGGRRRSGSAPERELSPGERARLEALGYAAGDEGATLRPSGVRERALERFPGFPHR